MGCGVGVYGGGGSFGNVVFLVVCHIMPHWENKAKIGKTEKC
jgi:hypothetical protein